MFSSIDPSMSDPVARDEHPPTILESALRYDRIPAVVLLVLVPLTSWIWIVVMARDMYGPMTGASAWMMTVVWDVPHLLLLWAMWAVMMTGMMLPSASPMCCYTVSSLDDPRKERERAGCMRSRLGISWSGSCSV